MNLEVKNKIKYTFFDYFCSEQEAQFYFLNKKRGREWDHYK